MRLVKTNSSRWVHRVFPAKRRFGWQAGYAAFSVSHSRFQEVFGYIQEQERHHEKVSFQQELLAFLERNEIEFDEANLWS